jgi:branched-subunit amino acid aminotransferase/4-amino-4-deoxychorismate lyase
VNGRLFAPREATVSALDAGFLLGDGLFESLRAGNGCAYLLDRHLARLHDAARDLEFARMPSTEEMAEQVGETLERAELEEAYLRITVTRGSGALALAPPDGPPTVVIAALPAPPRLDPKVGMAVALLGPAGERGPKAKSTSRQSAVLAKRRAQRAGGDEGIYVSGRGHVLEGTSSNVFAAIDGALITPPAEDCLPGITRGRLIELARQEGLDVREAPLTSERLLGADEAFVTNAVQGLRAIRSIDGHAIGAKRGVFAHEGGVFAKLLALYEADRAATGAGDRAGNGTDNRPRTRNLAR